MLKLVGFFGKWVSGLVMMVVLFLFFIYFISFFFGLCNILLIVGGWVVVDSFVLIGWLLFFLCGVVGFVVYVIIGKRRNCFYVI